MSKKVNVGVIGCGAIAHRLHIPDYAACDQAQLVAFCDVDKARAVEVANTFSPQAKTYSEHMELLSDPDVEAVSVCLPNKYHGSVTIDALRAGKHVLVEKPMAMNLAEAKKMVDEADKAGVMLLVNHSMRNYPAHRKAREVIQSGILGDVLHVTGMCAHDGPEHWAPDAKWFFNKAEARFGAMADLGVHKADAIRFITGREIDEIRAFYQTVEKKRTDVEDNFVSSFTLQGGGVGTLAASWTVQGGMMNYTIVHCSNGTLEILLHPDKPLVARMTRPQCEIVFDLPEPPIYYEGSWGLDVGGSFVRAILGKEEPFCTGLEGMKSLAVILAAEKAADTNRAVKVAL